MNPLYLRDPLDVCPQWGSSLRDNRNQALRPCPLECELPDPKDAA